MCNYSDYVEQKGIEKGRIETLSESVVNLVRSGTLTLDAALDVLQVSDDIRATVKENAEKALNQWLCCRCIGCAVYLEAAGPERTLYHPIVLLE